MNAVLQSWAPQGLPELATQRVPRPNGEGSVILVEGDSRPRVLADAELADLFPEATLWMLNNAAVLPASLWVEVEGSGARIELRIVSLNDESGDCSAIGLGNGDYQVQTEQRGQVPELRAGSWLLSSATSDGTRLEVLRQTGRLFELRCATGYRGLLDALYASGAPIQYAYTERPHELSEVQNSYVGRPWAIEPASAGRHLSASVLVALRTAGQELAWLTHAAGISSTGDAALDSLLPFPERFEIPEATAAAVAAARERGSLIVAVGSSTTRALEAGALPDGTLRSGPGLARLKLHAEYRPRVVDALLTGIHEAGSSHRELTRAFASDHALDTAWRLGAAFGLKLHEFGDAMLIRRA